MQPQPVPYQPNPQAHLRLQVEGGQIHICGWHHAQSVQPLLLPRVSTEPREMKRVT